MSFWTVLRLAAAVIFAAVVVASCLMVEPPGSAGNQPAPRAAPVFHR
ncbi:MAG: hypothetical protein MUC86_11920 [Burkholderiaceae bacterium]|jgi:hypothetical protein|nr:hypothetical protein [Burkholderiaceae bacterium]